jgi:hypothetical protein
MATGKLPPQVLTGFFALGVGLVALFAYAMSLRSQNQQLLERLALYEDGGEVVPEGEGTGTENVTSDDLAPPDLPTNLDPPAPETVVAGALTLGPAERATLASQLAFIAPDVDRRVWMTVTFGDPGAAQFASALGQVFSDAGFTVQPVTVARFPIRPGIYFMSADDEPPEHVTAMLSAIEATGYEVTSGRGYRAFYQEKKREDPEWNGFELAADQTFVIAIGRSGT